MEVLTMQGSGDPKQAIGAEQKRDAAIAPCAPSAKRGFTFISSNSAELVATPLQLAMVMAAHADQKPREKIFLYAMVFAFAPRRCLEIGVRWGGGSRIIAMALSDLGSGGVLVSVDPEPALEYAWNELGPKAVLLRGTSPGMLPEARLAAGGEFDFVFVDGDHSEEGVLGDLRGAASVVASGAVVLLHDAYCPPVARAISRAVEEGSYHDCGIVVTSRNAGTRLETGELVVYGGVHMLRRI